MSENNEIKEPLNKNYKVPKLRFPEFNDEWNNLRLGDILKIQNGKDQKEIEISSGIYKIYGTGGVIGYTNNFLYNKESVGIGRKGTINRPFYFNEPFWTVDTLFWSKIKEKNFPKFIYYLFFTIDWNKLNQSTGVPSLTNHVIEHQKIFIPKLDEQKKISMFFTIIDKKIDVINSKLSILKKYKEGVFLDTRKCSKKIALKNILSEVNIKTKYNNQYEILSSTAIGLFSQKEYFKHQVASENNVGYKVIKKDQLLFSPQNLWLGNINLNNDFEIGMVSPSYKIYDIDNSINSSWLISMLKSQNMLYKYKKISEQGASVVRRNLDLSQFLEITIDIPDNQIQIGITLETIDKKINALSNLFMNLKKLKMHLLNEMFI